MKRSRTGRQMGTNLVERVWPVNTFKWQRRASNCGNECAPYLKKNIL